MTGRRAVLKKSMVAGGIAWTVPVVMTLAEPVAAATGSVSGLAFWCFDDGTTEGWTIDNNVGAGNGLWNVDNSRSVSPSYSMHYGTGSGGDYDTGGRNAGTATSPTVTLPASGTMNLAFEVWREVETYPSGNWDRFTVSILAGATSTIVYSRARDGGTGGVFESPTIDVSAWAGQSIQIVLGFDTGDGAFNNFEGIYVDNIQIPVAAGGSGTSLSATRSLGISRGYFPETPEPNQRELRRRAREARQR